MLMSSNRPAAIVLDDDDSTNRASSPESDIGDVRDLMDLFSSDPITGIEETTPRPLRADRKGKGLAIPVSIPAPVRTSKDQRQYRDISSDLDGIASAKKKDTKEKEREMVGKRKSEDGAGGSKRIRTISEPEVSLVFGAVVEEMTVQG